MIGAALGDIRDRRLVDGRGADDRAADGDALTRPERADDGAVDVAVAFELATAAGVLALPGSSTSVRLVTHADIDDDDVARTVAALGSAP